MYLFRIFYSLFPLRNPIGFGASDLLILAIAILLAVLLTAKAFFAPYARQTAPRTLLCMGFLFSAAVALRVALLLHNPAPIPSGADDFSYILLGDTLRHFRLANAPHALHQFFEAVFVLQQPAYASIYPLGQGLVLALGGLLMNSAWAGVLITSGVFCALCYWMLRAWVAPIWALVGGLLAIIEFGPLNPWVNTYWGGSVSAIAGCLAFGSLPRLCQAPRIRYGLLLGAGIALQILTRPFEALFLVLAITVYLASEFRSNFPSAARPALAAIIVVATALVLTLLQNKAVTHRWTTMPYVLSRYEYGVPTTFTFQANPVPHRQLTPEQELDYRAQVSIHGPGTDTIAAYFRRLAYRFRYLRFFLLPPLGFAILAFLPTLRQRRWLWAAATVLLFALGTNFYPYFFPHYIAAVTCLFILLAVRGLEKLPAAARLSVFVLCCASFAFWFGLHLFGDPGLLLLTDYQSWNYINGRDPQGRATVEQQLARSPGEQLVFIRYSPAHRFEEWVHNDADIDSERTVWVNDLGTEENEKLLQYYPKRNAWLLTPDSNPIALIPYPRDSGMFLTVH